MKENELDDLNKMEIVDEDDDFTNDENLIKSLNNHSSKLNKSARKKRCKCFCKWFLSINTYLICLSIFIVLLIVSFGSRNKPESFIDKIKDHLRELHEIGFKHGGSRTAGTGFNASSDYIIGQLKTYGYNITKQHFTIPEFHEINPPVLRMDNKTYIRGEEFELLDGFHGNAYISGVIDSVDQYGCNEIDFRYFKTGNIALIKRGECSFSIKGNNAKKYGAIGVIVYNDINDLIRGNIGKIEIPVFMITKSIAEEFMSSTGSLIISMSVNVLLQYYYTHNIIAEKIIDVNKKVIVVGAHLDSVKAGPGINDNGSGSMTILQVAKEIDTMKNNIRFCWWAGEELGLLGSTYYVEHLNTKELSLIMLYLNFDMLASPNYLRAIYDARSSKDIDIRKGSIYIQNEFELYFNNNKLETQLTPFDGRSDYGPFIERGKPAGGLFSGAEKYKSREEREQVFGLIDVAYDPCYHQQCDDYYNLNMQGLDEMANAVLYIVKKFINEINIELNL